MFQNACPQNNLMETDGTQLRSLLTGDSNGYHGGESSQPMRQEKKKCRKQSEERSYDMPSSGKAVAVAHANS